MLSIDEKNRVPERTLFCFYGSYYGYPICCQTAFLARMQALTSTQITDANALDFEEAYDLKGTGYVPCRSCSRKSVDEQVTAINRFRKHADPFHHIHSRKTRDDFYLIDKLLINGELYKNHLEIVKAMARADVQGLLTYTEHELKAISRMFDDIADLKKEDRPKLQHAELRSRCVELGNLRYKLIRS